MTTPPRPLEPPVSPVPIQRPAASPPWDEPKAPEPDSEPEPELPELPPAAEAPSRLVRVLVRLRSGEQLEAAAFPDAQEAREHARALVDQLERSNAAIGAGRSLAVAEVDSIFLLSDA